MPGSPRFAESAAAAGIHWTHNPCRTGKKYLPETYGGGGGFFDYNRDGWLDVLLVNGAPLPGYRGPRPRHALYRNNRDGTFSDVTRETGLSAIDYGQGAAAGDYDNDGWVDLYLTGVGRNRLLHNDHGRFVDVTEAAGVGCGRWCTGAAWLDFDHDGRLDLFVASYVQWTPATDLPCGPPGHRQYCPPLKYRPTSCFLFRNVAAAGSAPRFEDVSARSGVQARTGKALSATPLDVNRDGWTDIFVANDTEPDLLLVNNRDGTFTDQALPAGVAVGADGRPTGSMGVDVATAFDDGRWCVAVGNFVGEGMSLFSSLPANRPGDLVFDNRGRAAGLAEATLPKSTFGVVFADVDLDGWPDLLALNGHLDENLAVRESQQPYLQEPQLFHNQRDGTFRDVASAAGIAAPFAGRGLAVGDYDNDGRPDFLAFGNGSPVRLWHNETKSAEAWLAVELTGSSSPRDGQGALVTVIASGHQQSRVASTTRSYLAVNDPRVHFGLGNASRADSVEIRWSSGRVQRLSGVAANQVLRVHESDH